MNSKKTTARYKQLRLLITRAKEDAARWGTDQKPLILIGIKETSAHDYTVYDDAYNKFVKQRMNQMSESKLNAAEEEENDKNHAPLSFSEQEPTRAEIQLTRIADSLERILYYLEKESELNIDLDH